MAEKETPYIKILRDQPEKRYVDQFNKNRVRHFARFHGSLRWATFLQLPNGSLVLKGEQGTFQANTPFNLTSGARLGFIETN